VKGEIWLKKKVVKTGDILLYYPSNLIWEAVVVGEILEDGIQDKEYCHVAIALNDREKIEADGHAVVINPIDYKERFDVYTVSEDRDAIHKALTSVQKYLGQGYDWLEIIDQALRDLSHGLLHLPKHLIMQSEAHRKICSTLAAVYLKELGIEVKELPSPEDIYLAITRKHKKKAGSSKNENNNTQQQVSATAENNTTEVKTDDTQQLKQNQSEETQTIEGIKTEQNQESDQVTTNEVNTDEQNSSVTSDENKE
jgi:hypothetical protein